MKIKCFGVAREIVNGALIEIKAEDIPQNVQELRAYLHKHFPSFSKYKSCMIAVNQAYANDDTTLSENDEIAIIPPVSGG